MIIINSLPLIVYLKYLLVFPVLYVIEKQKILELTEAERVVLEKGFRFGEKHCFRIRCRAVLLKADGLSSVTAGAQT